MLRRGPHRTGSRQLAEAEPEAPDQLSDRAADAWEPLLAIADALGGEWPARARSAAVGLFEAARRLEESIEVLVLEAIRGAFDSLGQEELASEVVCLQLNGHEDAPWREWRNGTGITAARLARLLKPFGIEPLQMRPPDLHGKQLRGYRRADFEDTWTRYLAPQSGTDGAGEETD